MGENVHRKQRTIKYPLRAVNPGASAGLKDTHAHTHTVVFVFGTMTVYAEAFLQCDPPPAECALEDETYEDGAETQVECNSCVCACGNWVCTAMTCTGRSMQLGAGNLTRP